MSPSHPTSAPARTLRRPVSQLTCCRAVRRRAAHGRTWLPPGPVRAALGLLLLAGAGLPVAACASETPPPAPTPTVAATTPDNQPTEPRDQLAAYAAAAQDRRLVAAYTLSAAGRPDRTVSVTRALDGSWRVDIPGGALSGGADVSIAQNGSGLFQCALPGTGGVVPAGCVRVADPGQSLDAGLDPRLQHLFTDWPEVLTDRQAPLSVSAAPLPGARGRCFAVEPTSTSVSPPLDSGIYCYDPDGTLTAARLAAGDLRLAGTPAAGPASITLPGPLVDRAPLRIVGVLDDPAGADGPAGNDDNPAGNHDNPTRNDNPTGNDTSPAETTTPAAIRAARQPSPQDDHIRSAPGHVG